MLFPTVHFVRVLLRLIEDADIEVFEYRTWWITITIKKKVNASPQRQ